MVSRQGAGREARWRLIESAAIAGIVAGVVAALAPVRLEEAVLAVAALAAAVLVFGAARVAQFFLVAWLLADGVFNWGFAHVAIGHLGPLPLYPTEPVMAICFLLLLATGRLRTPRYLKWPLLSLTGLMFLAALLGKHAGYATSTVVRESALIYYMWFIVLAYSAFDTRRQMMAVALAFSGCAFVSAVMELSHHGHNIPEAVGGFCGTAALFMIAGMRMRPARGIVYFFGAVVMAAAVFTNHARGAWVALAVGLVVAWWRPRHMRTNPSITGAAAVMLVAAGVVASLAADPALLAHFASQAGSLVGGGSRYQVANNHWRLVMWGLAIKNIVHAPLQMRVGAPFDPVQTLLSHGFTGYIATGVGLAGSVIELSNSHLQLVLWYGVEGAVFYVWLWWAILNRLVLARRSADANTAHVLTAGIAAMALWLALAGTEVVLEGPYMGGFVWVLAGGMLLYADTTEKGAAAQ